MYTKVVAMDAAVILVSIQVILVPFRPRIKAGTTSIDVSGDALSSEILENISVAEFVITML